MGITITKLKMWKNPGYTKTCVDVPPIGSKRLPTPDWVNNENLRPRKNSTLSAVELPLSYLEVLDMSYLYIEATDNATPTPHTVSVFGWILSIEEIASSENAVRITWEIDWWRSYASNLTFEKGVITKSSDPAYRRPLNINPRRYRYDSEILISRDPTLYEATYHRCIIFTYIDNGSLRLGVTAPKMKAGSEIKTGLTIAEADDLPTKFNIPSDKIKGCWICPYPPFTTSYWEEGDYQLNLTEPPNWKSNGGNWWIEKPEVYSNLYIRDFAVDVMTDETTYYTVCDGYGTPYLTLPFGIPVKKVQVALDVGATEAYISVALGESASSPSLIGETERIQYINQGLFVNIPLPAISITSSALSDYYASGQRDFDINSRRIMQEKQFWSGLAGVGGSAIGGSVAGGMSKAGAGKGAIAGTVLGLAQVGVDFAITGKTDDELQQATDMLYSNQSGTLITIGNTGRGMLSSVPVRIVKMVSDSQSASDIANQILTQGYDINMPVTSVNGYIPSEGVFQVRNLQLTGDAPLIAKEMIKSKLESGVYIIERNPSGVIP